MLQKKKEVIIDLFPYNYWIIYINIHIYEEGIF